MTHPATDPAPGNTPTALVLDVDGTLLDTVYLHVIAWWEAFRDGGYEVSGFDIHRAIGRGSEDLVETLLGNADDGVVGLAQQRLDEVLAAAADRTVQVEGADAVAVLLERQPPGVDVQVDGVEQRAVDVEQQGRGPRRGVRSHERVLPG